jgi:amidophosphoribosyltransferase
MMRPTPAPASTNARAGGFHDECGVFGIFGHPEAANLAYLGLYALQHRGQESAGIVSSDGSQLYRAVGMGQVADVFPSDELKRLKGMAAVGHVRYSTAGSSHLVNAQPILIAYHSGEIAIGHNGNLVNAAQLRTDLERAGSIFQSTSDTEVILHLIARSHFQNLDDAITDALGRVEGAFSVVFLARDRIVAVRDPRGFRPLSIGRVDGAWCVASESCAFVLIGAELVRDVEPGEMVILDAGGLRSVHPFPAAPVSQCVFEYVYFARPDSKLFGQGVQGVRKRMGAALAEEHPVAADIVVPVPDSGVFAALGYAEKSGIPFEMGLVRNHYVGRTFIEPKQSIRHFGVKIKLNPVRELLAGKKVVLVDDSIVRGTTSRKIVSMIKEAGAKEVHVRISCPPTVGPCYYGVDTPNRSELIASSHTVDEIRKYIRASSLGYLSLAGLKAAVSQGADRYCDACYTLNYPVPLTDDALAQLPLFSKPRS